MISIDGVRLAYKGQVWQLAQVMKRSNMHIFGVEQRLWELDDAHVPGRPFRKNSEKVAPFAPFCPFGRAPPSRGHCGHPHAMARRRRRRQAMGTPSN